MGHLVILGGVRTLDFRVFLLERKMSTMRARSGDTTIVTRLDVNRGIETTWRMGSSLLPWSTIAGS